jgi:hypothetical protein
VAITLVESKELGRGLIGTRRRAARLVSVATQTHLHSQTARLDQRHAHACTCGADGKRPIRDHGVVPVRVLLDNNVWRRVADDGVAQVLRRRSKEAGAAVLVAPAVVYEMLRTPNPATRDRLIKTVTLGSWTRLRTEVYYACAEVRNLVTRHRRHWLIEHPDLRSYYRLEADWGPGGWFWRRARGDNSGGGKTSVVARRRQA